MKFEITIFIASPSDVTTERNTIEEVCKTLEKEYKNNISIKPIRWENYPQSYHQDAQTNINTYLQPSECDIVIVVFWHRFGTFLPKNYIGPITKDCPVTGTQWEFEEALASKKPAIHFYLKKAKLNFLKDKELNKQYALLQNFLRKIGVHHGNAHHGFHEFNTPKEFKQRLYNHLKIELDRLIKEKKVSFYSKFIFIALFLLMIFGFYFYDKVQVKYLKNNDKNKSVYAKSSLKIKEKNSSNSIILIKKDNNASNPPRTSLHNAKPKTTHKKNVLQKVIIKKANNSKDKNNSKNITKAKLHKSKVKKQKKISKKDIKKKLYDFLEYWLWAYNSTNIPAINSLYEKKIIFNKIEMKRDDFIQHISKFLKKYKKFPRAIDKVKIQQLSSHIYKISFVEYLKIFKRTSKNNKQGFIIVNTAKKRFQIIEEGVAVPKFYKDAQPKPYTLMHLKGINRSIYKNYKAHLIFRDSRIYHLKGAKCFNIPFHDNGKIGIYGLTFSSYGADALQIKLNKKQMGKPMNQEKIGFKNSNFWTNKWQIYFDNQLKKRKNIISICSSLVRKNGYDDFMIKNTSLYRIAP